MITISSSDVIKNPSLVTNPKDLTVIEDVKKKLTKSVVIPYEIYKKIKEDIEYRLWLERNKGLLKNAPKDLEGIFDEAIYEMGKRL